MDTTKLENIIQDAIREAVKEEEQAAALGEGDSCTAYALLSSILAYALSEVNGLLESAHREMYGRL
ncbi:MAG: hypothetical protein DDT19_00068 [Syntrophomonadaceae bacterium]|nr:hypothetical protein [Bacillota bacterium]